MFLRRGAEPESEMYWKYIEDEVSVPQAKNVRRRQGEVFKHALVTMRHKITLVARGGFVHIFIYGMEIETYVALKHDFSHCVNAHIVPIL